MAPGPRQPLAIALAALVPAVLAAGIWLGGHPDSLPAPVRDALVRDGDARTIDRALDIVHEDYFRDRGRGRLVDDALRGVAERLGDRFSSYLDPREYRRFQTSTSGEFSGVGLSVREHPRGLRVVGVFAGSPAARAGLGAGDLIVAVNGRSIAGKPSGVATALIKGPPGTAVALTVVTDGRRRVERLRRAQVSVPAVTSELRARGGERLAHVTLSTFSSGAHGEVRRAIDRLLRRGARGVVLDLRGNGGGLLDEAVLVASVFIERGTVVTTDGRSRPRRVLRATGDAIDAGVPVAVLVDEGTASASEIVAGALQDRRRATVVGTRTFGKGVFQEVRRLPNGGALDLTVGQYFLPSGRNIGGAGGARRGAGIAPDVRARDRRGTRRDEALEAALAVLAARAR